MKYQNFLYLFALLHLYMPGIYGHSTDKPDTYQVTFDGDHTLNIHVEARITLEDSRLYMSPFGPVPDRWYDYIRNLTVLADDGHEIAVEKTADGGWSLKGTETGQIANLKYDMVLEHEGINWPGGIDGVAYKRDWGIMASGRSLFVMNGESKRDLSISFTHPPEWKVSVPWETAFASSDSYVVESLIDLQESFIFAGTHREVTMERDGFILKFVMGGEAVQKEQKQYLEVAEGVMDYYIRKMGGIPRSAPGFNVRQSMVIISESESVDGEVIGNHISMFMNPKGDSMQQMMGWFMFAHEFFHLWNGKTLRFKNTETDWFKEGISNYYTMKALCQIKFANEQALLTMLDKLFYQRYINDPGYGTIAPSQAASGFNKDNHWGIIYGGGLFAGIAMDMEIRKKTFNNRSLDDLMHFFYNEFGGTERLITSEDILVNANRIGGTNFKDLLGAAIEGTDPVPLSQYLVYAGVEVATDSGQLIFGHKEEKTALEMAIWNGFLGNN